MKKLYKRIEFKLYNKNRSRRAMNRLSKLKRRPRCEKVLGQPVKRKYEKIKAPDNFSIVYNPDSTIYFFSSIFSAIKKSKPIQVNLSAVKEITPDAILYLLVLLQEAKNRRVIFKGNAPKDSKAHSVFVHSGFYEFVNSPLNKFAIPADSNILKIKTGKNVNGDEAANIQNYLKEHLNNITTWKLQAIYSILIECMSNTNEYAAGSKVTGEKYWWIMALYDVVSGKVLFAFVDNGVGIPSTVKRNFFDNSSDAELLKKAAMGRYQMSGSKNKARNRGLPQIRKFNESGLIQNLVIISNNGYYSVNDDMKILNEKFTGTLLAWEFI